MGTLLFVTGLAIIVSGFLVLLTPSDVARVIASVTKGVDEANYFVTRYQRGIYISLLLIGSFVVFNGYDHITRVELERTRTQLELAEKTRVAATFRVREAYLQDAIDRITGTSSSTVR
ncbi:MAG: hypothetical protein JW844_08080 [Candidatus Omnitrophica bacterium]|nr:hypothetical protein [Candidatus Omnitrophota bacterium]